MLHIDANGCPSQYVSGTSDYGPYNSLADCQASIPANNGNVACVQYTCLDNGSSSGTASDGSLADNSAKAITEGIVNGDEQSVGAGLLGLGVMGLLSGMSSSQQPSQAEIQAQQQRQEQQQEEAAREAQARQQAAEQAAQEAAQKAAEFQAEKQNARAEMKGDGTDVPDDDDDLKDAQGDGQPPIPHLVPLPNDPLHPHSKPGDTRTPRFFDSWDEAKAACGPNQTEALDHETGKVVACPSGFPFYANGKCYSDDAFNSLRVPDSVLKTDHQFSDTELK